MKFKLIYLPLALTLSLSSCFYQRFNADYLEKTYESTSIMTEGNPPITIVSASMTFKYIDETDYINSQSINVYKDDSISPNRYVSYEFKYVNELNETHSISFKTDIVGYESNDGIKMHIDDSNYQDWSAIGLLYAQQKNIREVVKSCIYIIFTDINLKVTKDRYFINLE